MPRIQPFLWFDGKADEAAAFYAASFERSRIVSTTRFGGSGAGKPGSVMTVELELDGQRLVLLNGGPHYTLTPAFSLAIACETQREIDRLWDRLLEGGGKALQCGWLTDRFGVTWQVFPASLPAMLQDPDAARTQRVMAVMMPMKKLDLAALEKAYGKG
jgi:predicted 3-demethylubiquinone-9 3-methyltransferase (glyoxalase superfamily)